MTEMEGIVPMEEVVDATISVTEIPSTVNAETIDGRTGYNGTEYESIGEAIRTQVSDLWEGKAPSGHGLGGTGAYVDNLDTLKTTGVYTFTHGAVGNPFSGWGGIAVVLASKTGIKQILHCNQNNGTCAERSMFIDSNKDTFEEWEWVNPPMIPNTEYKTTERWNKKPVYTALIDCGTCPSTSIKTVAHGKSVGRILKVHASLSASGITAPYFNTDNYNSANNYLDVTATATNVLVKSTTTGWASSGYTVTAQIWYVKV